MALKCIFCNKAAIRVLGNKKRSKYPSYLLNYSPSFIKSLTTWGSKFLVIQILDLSFSNTYCIPEGTIEYDSNFQTPVSPCIEYNLLSLNIMKSVDYLYNHYKNSAKRRNIPFNLTKLDFYNLSYPVTCPILNIPMAHNPGRPCDNSYSIDRIDSAKGYELDNIIVISYRANVLKNNATLAELTQLVNFYTGLANST